MFNEKYTNSMCNHEFEIILVTCTDNVTSVVSVCNKCNQEEKWIINKIFENEELLLEYLNTVIANNTKAYNAIPSFMHNKDVLSLRKSYL